MLIDDWTPVTDRLPDDCTLVLLEMDDEDVWPGFRDGDIWRDSGAMPIAESRVTGWMHLPPARRALASTAEPIAMKLQLKDSGAWRDLVGFKSHQEEEVRHAAVFLMRCATNPKATLRIVEGDKVHAYCEAPFLAWRAS